MYTAYTALDQSTTVFAYDVQQDSPGRVCVTALGVQMANDVVVVTGEGGVNATERSLPTTVPRVTSAVAMSGLDSPRLSLSGAHDGQGRCGKGQ